MEIKGALQEDWCTRQGLERGGKCRECSGPQIAERTRKEIVVGAGRAWDGKQEVIWGLQERVLEQGLRRGS